MANQFIAQLSDPIYICYSIQPLLSFRVVCLLTIFIQAELKACIDLLKTGHIFCHKYQQNATVNSTAPSSSPIMLNPEPLFLQYRSEVEPRSHSRPALRNHCHPHCQLLSKSSLLAFLMNLVFEPTTLHSSKLTSFVRCPWLTLSGGGSPKI
jgi:hypothetical protein